MYVCMYVCIVLYCIIIFKPKSLNVYTSSNKIKHSNTKYMNKTLLAKSYVMVLIGQGLAEGRNYLIAKPLCA